MSEKKLVYGRCDLGYEYAVIGVVRLVVLGGEPGVHRVARLVREGGHVVVVAVVVEKNIRLGVGAACAERAAALASGGVNVNPALFGKAGLKGVVILVTVDLYGIEHLLNSLLIAVLTGERADEGGVDVVEVELVKAEHLALECVVVVEGLKTRLDRLYKVVIDLGSNLVLEGRCGEGVLEAARPCKGRFLSDTAVKQGGKGVGKLAVGSVHLLECRHTDAALGGAEVDAVARICELNALSVLALDLAESHIRVCKNASDIIVRAEAVTE